MLLLFSRTFGLIATLALLVEHTGQRLVFGLLGIRICRVVRVGIIGICTRDMILLGLRVGP